MKHPIQPLELDDNGIMRFKRNMIVEYLLKFTDMNKLSLMPFSNEDREQFAQLIGYSLSGFSELGYVSNETVEAAQLMAEGTVNQANSMQARLYAMSEQIEKAREGVKLAAIALFDIHPDDLSHGGA